MTTAANDAAESALVLYGAICVTLAATFLQVHEVLRPGNGAWTHLVEHPYGAAYLTL